MNVHRFKRLLSLLLVAALLAGFYVPTARAASTGLRWEETDKEIRPDMTDRVVETQVEETHRPSDIVRVSIVLEDKPTIQAGYGTRNIVGNAEAMTYSSQLKAKQDALAQAISTQALDGKKLDVVWNLTLAANLISAKVPYGKIDAIAQVEGVKAVILENTYTPCVIEREDVAQPQMYASVQMTGSSLLWSSGFTGAGSRIAVLDTGTDTNHQSLDSGAFLYALEQNAKAADMSYEEYVASLDLLDAQEITSVLPYLNFKQLYSGVTAAQLYLNEKLPFAANYIDGNLVVDHESDYQGEHGSHVAGIATANRYIPSGEGYVDALETVLMAGIAPDAQLITMKLFGASGGPTDSDYMAAVEDAIYLGCDSVNLSLGSSVSDFSFNTHFAELLEYMTQTDTVVVASAGNSYSWPETTLFGRPYTGDVALDTVGSPGSYNNFFTVASVENDGGVGLFFQAAGHTSMYADGSESINAPLTSLDTSDDLSGTEYDFVFIDGLGDPGDYAGMDLSNKVVFCSRGVTNFAVKAETAVSLGAVATIVYNNQPGIFGMNMSGYSKTAPCASIAQADANAIRAGATAQTTADGVTYYTGTITVYGDITGYVGTSEYYTMSDFSSWGVPGDLSLKPEITAPGGNIYSLYGQTPSQGGGPDQYELMSGTSMAAPAITGMVALMAQFIRESGLDEQENLTARTLAQSLLMSTAVPIMEEASGSYYSLLKQGAGLARTDLAVSADSYILVDGQADGKVKAELGDDPDRTGVYEFSFSINNLTDKDLPYALRADVFRQDAYDPGLAAGGQAYGFMVMDLSTTTLPAAATFYVNGVQVEQNKELDAYDLNGDGFTNALDADYLLEYLLGNETALSGEGDVNGDGNVNTYDAHVLLTLLNSTSSVTVPAGESVTVSVRLALTASAKQTLDQIFENGTFVEAFVYAESLTDEEGVVGTSHSIPVLAFYGNWSDPNMFDYGTVAELMGSNPYVGMFPYMYQMVQTGTVNSLTIDYGDGQEFYYGGNPFVQDNTYLAERNSFNSEDASMLYGQYFTLIRNASNMRMVITNAETGEVYYLEDLGPCLPAYYFVNYGSWQNVEQRLYLGWTGTDANGEPLPTDTVVDVSLIAVPEYYRDEDGTHSYEDLGRGVDLTTRMVIDNVAPEITHMDLEDTILTVEGLDNRHVAAVILTNGSGSSLIAAATPNQTEVNAPISVELDLANVMGKTFLLGIYDYANNYTTYEITLDLPEVERSYFTAIDYQTQDYVGMDLSCNVTHLSSTGLPVLVRAAEYVGGYVFIVTEDNVLCVTNDEDLSSTYRICQMDPNSELLITGFSDLAYNYADGKLYGQFYSQYNYEEFPYLCTIDMGDGSIEVICELPEDVNTMAIDTQGNFYSAGFATSQLYTYTLADVTSDAPSMTLVGAMGYYYSNTLSTMFWDHNTDKLYWAYPNTLLEINPETAEVTLLGYYDEMLVGLYTRPEEDEGMFDPTNQVDRVELNYSNARAIIGYALNLEASVWPWNASDRSVSWTSSDTSVATVDANGVVKGVTEGTVTITATSNLDPTKSASCTITVDPLPVKTLNALVWDEAGEIWMSEFSTDDLPNYTKLSAESVGLDLASATIGQDGTIYAASLEVNTLKSNLYKLDPETFEATLIGPSTDGYVDLAPAPGQRGNSLMAVFGGNVLNVDATTGDYYNHYYMFAYNLVGLAYVGTQEYKEWGYDTMVDWYFIIDRLGNVYLMGFLEQDGSFFYLEHDVLAPGGIYTQLNFEMDTAYFGSAYFDGEYLYFSAYKESQDNVTLMAIDVAGGTKACYTLGTFDKGVWPVAGLMELGLTEVPDYMSLGMNSQPKAAVNTAALSSLSVSGTSKVVPNGGLNSIVPQSSGDYHDEPGLIVLELTGVDTAPNGLMTVTYDPSAMRIASVSGMTDAFAYKLESGKITIAFANATAQPTDTVMAILAFEPLKAGTHTVTVNHLEAGNEETDKVETLTVEVPAQEEEYTAKWKTISTTLTGNIGLNFYAELSENLVNNADAYVRFTFCGRTIDVPVADAVISANNEYRFTCPITAKNMTDDVTAQVMVGGTPVGEAKTMDVATYCNWVIANYTDAKTVNLMKAMLNYGASAQLLFSYNTDNLANAALSEADKVLAEVDASAYAHTVAGTEEGIKANQMTLLLDSETTIRVYFELTGDKTIDQYTFYVDGKEVTPVEKNGLYYVQIPNISAHRLGQMYEVTVGGITVTYGALSYVNQVMNYPEATAETVNMAKALFAYYEAAIAYKG